MHSVILLSPLFIDFDIWAWFWNGSNSFR